MNAPRHHCRLAVQLRALPLALALSCGLVAVAGAQDISAAQAISEAQGAIRAEVLKAATARKAYSEGLEAFRTEQRMRMKAAELADALRQPDGLCQTMDTQDAMATGGRRAQQQVVANQRKAMSALTGSKTSAQAVEAAHRATNERFCSAEEAERGVCRLAADGRYANLAGADQNAMFLFQSREGGNSYEGGRDGAQADAADAYIRRVVGGVPPEQLRAKGGAAYAQSPQARAYAELQRRYAAYLSMSAYSLNQIKESRNPLK